MRRSDTSGLDWEKHVEIDPRYFRPAEVRRLHSGDPSRRGPSLGWKPKVTFHDWRSVRWSTAELAEEGRSIKERPDHRRPDVMSIGQDRRGPRRGGFLGARSWRARRGGAEVVRSPGSRDYDLTPGRPGSGNVRGRAPPSRDPPRRAGGRDRGEPRLPGTFFYDNLMMGVAPGSSGRTASRSSSASARSAPTPSSRPVPFHEDDIWNGYPEETNAPYGLAKKDAARAEPGLPAAVRVPTASTAVPGQPLRPGDNFDPDTSHVIPALIRKCVEAVDAGRTSTGWGTGAARASSSTSTTRPRGASSSRPSASRGPSR